MDTTTKFTWRIEMPYYNGEKILNPHQLCPCTVSRVPRIEEWNHWRVTFWMCSRCSRRFKVEVWCDGERIGTGTQAYMKYFYARIPHYDKRRVGP